LHLDRAALHSNLGHTADLVHHTEITLRAGTYSEYHLALYVGNENIEVESHGTKTWTPVQLLYAPRYRCIYLLKALCVQGYFSNIRDARGDPKIHPYSILDEEPTGEGSDRPTSDFR